MTYLDDIYADLLAVDAQRPRSKQVAIGGSQLFGCRAEQVLRLNGVPQSDPRLSWQAFVGSAIDHRLGEARKQQHPQLLIQERVEFRGTWFSVDEYSPDTRTITDYKTKDDARACKRGVKMMTDSLPGHETKRAQLHGGAAALIQAGHPVDTVQLVFLPRAGGWAGAVTWDEPYDETWAVKGAAWAAAVQQIATTDVDLLDLQDKDPGFCAKFCSYVSTCRGPW